MANKLEVVIEGMVEVFEEYASKGEKKHQIDEDELKEMLEKEVEQSGLKDKMNAEDLKEATELLDKNHDGEVNIREFSRFVAALAKGYYKQKRGKGKKKDDS